MAIDTDYISIKYRQFLYLYDLMKTDWQKRRDFIQHELQAWVMQNASKSSEFLHRQLCGWADCILLHQYVHNLEQETGRQIDSGILITSEDDYWGTDVKLFLTAESVDVKATLMKIVLGNTLPVQPGLIPKERLQQFKLRD